MTSLRLVNACPVCSSPVRAERSTKWANKTPVYITKYAKKIEEMTGTDVKVFEEVIRHFECAYCKTIYASPWIVESIISQLFERGHNAGSLYLRNFEQDQFIRADSPIILNLLDQLGGWGERQFNYFEVGCPFMGLIFEDFSKSKVLSNDRRFFVPSTSKYHWRHSSCVPKKNLNCLGEARQISTVQFADLALLDEHSIVAFFNSLDHESNILEILSFVLSRAAYVLVELHSSHLSSIQHRLYLDSFIENIPNIFPRVKCQQIIQSNELIEGNKIWLLSQNPQV